MKLYYHPLSTYSQKVLIALYEKGLDFDGEVVQLMNPESRDKYREVYPIGKVPCLVLDDGHLIPESSIIIEYLDPLAKPTLIKGNADEKRKIRFKDRMFDLYLNDPIGVLFFQNMKPENERDPERVEKARFHIATMYGLMEMEFAKQPYANGEEFLMSDCAAAPPLFYAERIAPFAEHKNISAYWQRLKSRPSVQRVLDEAAPILAEMAKQNAA